MRPFDSYSGRGIVLLDGIGGGTCRHDYGPKFQQRTNQTMCAYCGISLVDTYEHWLQMAIDHVVPKSVCASLGIQPAWMEDCINKVLSCAACNGFKNRFKPHADTSCPATLDEFCALRDRLFAERKVIVAERHIVERAFYDKEPWKTVMPPARLMENVS
jgi:hypothetical protein